MQKREEGREEDQKRVGSRLHECFDYIKLMVQKQIKIIQIHWREGKQNPKFMADSPEIQCSGLSIYNKMKLEFLQSQRLNYMQSNQYLIFSVFLLQLVNTSSADFSGWWMKGTFLSLFSLPIQSQMNWSINPMFAASCFVLAQKTFPAPDQQIAPKHIGHGSQLVQISHPSNLKVFKYLQAFRMATTSPWAVGSFVNVTQLNPSPTIFQFWTITQPKGPPFCSIPILESQTALSKNCTCFEFMVLLQSQVNKLNGEVAVGIFQVLLS